MLTASAEKAPAEQLAHGAAPAGLISPGPQARHGALLEVHVSSQPRPAPPAVDAQRRANRPVGETSQPYGSCSGAVGSEESSPVKTCIRHAVVMSTQLYTCSESCPELERKTRAEPCVDVTARLSTTCVPAGSAGWTSHATLSPAL